MQKHIIPRVYLDTNDNIHTGVNQLIFGQHEFESTISLNEIHKHKFIIPKVKPLLIKEIKYNYYYDFSSKEFNKIKKKVKVKPYYNINKIDELFEYYFTSAINSQPYCPKELNSKQLIYNIENYENNLSTLINKIFENLLQDIRNEKQIYRN